VDFSAASCAKDAYSVKWLCEVIEITWSSFWALAGRPPRRVPRAGYPDEFCHRDLAQLLSKSKQTVYSYLKRGDIAGTFVGSRWVPEWQLCDRLAEASNQAPGTRHQAPGTRHQAPGTRHQLRVCRCS
jgi:hypothetical protein